MKATYIKYEKFDEYNFPKFFGINVEEIYEPDMIDDKIKELKDKKCKTIFISNELASFSEDIVNKYKNDDKLNIIIIP